jgi:hypothetical protein
MTLDKRVLLQFNDGAFADPFYASQMSDGTLKIFAYLLLMEDPEPPPFICIEEPENGLYHRLLDSLASELRSHATGKKNAPQVFVTTHQPYFLDALTPSEVWILEKGSDGFSSVRRASDMELTSKADPAKRALLSQLPRLLAAYGKTPGCDNVVVVVDSDTRNCKQFLAELQAVLQRCAPAPRTLFRLAIEEMEAWLLGDNRALLSAYPKAKRNVLARYAQDSVCGTWELLADAVHPGGYAAIQKAGWPLPGQVKHQWVEKISPHMDIEANASPSFGKFRDGLRRMAASPDGLSIQK